ncbi:MAG: hypothetical protein P4M01_00745 [Acidobacteriota bacterium]|nr:hypothetical protein [Acidobacteriota bacterium]
MNLRLLIFVLFLLSSFSFGQSDAVPHVTGPAVKGHFLGETPREFLAKSPQLRNKIASCRQHPDGGDEGVRQFTNQFAELGGTHLTTCSDLLKTNFNDPDVSFTVVNIKLFNPAVEKLLNMFSDKDSPVDQSQQAMLHAYEGFLEFYGSVEFSHGRLVTIEAIEEGSWDDLRADLIHKFGNPNSVEQSQVQNNYGAVFTLSVATWKRPGYVVLANEMINLQSLVRSVDLQITTAERASHLIKQQQEQHHNAFD